MCHVPMLPVNMARGRPGKSGTLCLRAAPHVHSVKCSASNLMVLPPGGGVPARGAHSVQTGRLQPPRAVRPTAACLPASRGANSNMHWAHSMLAHQCPTPVHFQPEYPLGNSSHRAQCRHSDLNREQISYTVSVTLTHQLAIHQQQPSVLTHWPLIHWPLTHRRLTTDRLSGLPFTQKKKTALSLSENPCSRAGCQKKKKVKQLLDSRTACMLRFLDNQRV